MRCAMTADSYVFEHDPGERIPLRDSHSTKGRHAGARKRRRWCRDSEGGFTLVEILVVITIIGLIMALVGPRVLNYLAESKVKTARIQIQSFGSALDLFYLDAGRYPSSAEGLAVLVRPTTGIAAWNGPYLKGGVLPSDPWGKPYLY